MTIHFNTLKNLNFTCTHQLVMERDSPVFRIHSSEEPNTAMERDTRPVVYMWLSPSEGTDEFDVLYIGKAGYGVNRRVSQHQAGFTHSGTGRDNRRLITEWLAAGNRTIEVHCRVSSVHRVFDQEVSLYSVEEQALCERYAPLWNRARFPQISRLGLASQVETFQLNSGEGQCDKMTANTEPLTPAGIEADFSQVAQGDEITVYLDSLDADKRAQFLSLCRLLQRRAPNAQQKLVGGYSGQPRGYDGKPMYVFGYIGKGGKAHNRVGWISLTDSDTAPLTVIFPANALLDGVPPTLISKGATEDWRPLNLSHFLGHVGEYLK